MKKQITRISIQQTSRILALMYLFLTAFVFVPIGVYCWLSCGRGWKDSALFFVLPPAYSLLAYGFFALAAWIYNCLAARFGGIEFTVEDSDETKSKNTGANPGQQ